MTNDPPRPFRDHDPAPLDAGCMFLAGVATLAAAATAATIRLLLRRIRR